MKDNVVMITGAAGGIGEVLCRKLAEMGAKLALGSNQEEKLPALCGELETRYGSEVFGMVMDVTKEEDVEKFVKETADRYGHIDALINLAGLSIPGKIEETAEADYDLTMDVNVKGVFLMAKQFAGYASEDAKIINIGSMAARRTNGNAPLYCVAKAAVNVLSQGLAIQLAEKKIHVTTLNPGGADTPFWGDRPVKREKLLRAEDIAAVILFVLEADSRMAIHSIDFESALMLG